MAETRKSDGANAAGRIRPDALEAWTRFKDELKERYPIDRAIEDFSGARLTARFGQGDRMGHCPFHDDANPSMSVRPAKGRFRCHAAGCGANGDVFDFISLIRNVGFGEAVLLAAEKVGLEPPSGARPRSPVARAKGGTGGRSSPAELRENDLVPAFAGIRIPLAGSPFPVWHPGGGRSAEPGVKWYWPEMIHVYRDMDRRPVMAILRCLGGGGKYFIPIRVGRIPGEVPDFAVDDRERGAGWVVGGPGAGRLKPIYGMEDAGRWIADGGRRILVVEGEKTREAACRMIGERSDSGDWLVLSPMGGHGACRHADWSAFMRKARQRGLSGATFAVWPDADPVATRAQGGRLDVQALYAREACRAFAAAMSEAGMDPTEIRFVRALPAAGLKSGWDLADAEAEGWSGNRVVSELDGSGAIIAMDNQEPVSGEEPDRGRAITSSVKEPETGCDSEPAMPNGGGAGVPHGGPFSPSESEAGIDHGGFSASNFGSAGTRDDAPSTPNVRGAGNQHDDRRSTAQGPAAADTRSCRNGETSRLSVSGHSSRRNATAEGDPIRNARISIEAEVPDDGPSAF